MDGIRINKYLSGNGICSRREADRLIEEGRVSINGLLAESGMKVSDGDTVTLDGRAIARKSETEKELIAFYKPKGIVCTSTGNDRAENIIDYIGYDKRIFPIGRLDKDSEGLILLTNMGELVNSVNRSVFSHEKEYVVQCERRISEGFLKKMSEGVTIKLPIRKKKTAVFNGTKRHVPAYENEYELVTTKPCRVKKLSQDTFSIVLTQGMNRQIRRMCSAMGNPVKELKRVRVMNIRLGSLKEGEYRRVEGAELEEFLHMIKKADTGLA